MLHFRVCRTACLPPCSPPQTPTTPEPFSTDCSAMPPGCDRLHLQTSRRNTKTAGCSRTVSFPVSLCQLLNGVTAEGKTQRAVNCASTVANGLENASQTPSRATGRAQYSKLRANHADSVSPVAQTAQHGRLPPPCVRNDDDEPPGAARHIVRLCSAEHRDRCAADVSEVLPAADDDRHRNARPARQPCRQATRPVKPPANFPAPRESQSPA